MIPNILTLFRILSIPAIVTCFFLGTKNCLTCAAILFILSCITDFLDGFIARRYKQTSRLGQLLDPIADKLLIVATMIMLIGFNNISGLNIIAGLIIVLREIMISGTREYLSTIGQAMPVSTISKWKTGVQMLALSILIIADATQTPALFTFGIISLWVAAVITTISGLNYLKIILRNIF